MYQLDLCNKLLLLSRSTGEQKQHNYHLIIMYYNGHVFCDYSLFSFYLSVVFYSFRGNLSISFLWLLCNPLEINKFILMNE